MLDDDEVEVEMLEVEVREVELTDEVVIEDDEMLLVVEVDDDEVDMREVVFLLLDENEVMEFL